MVGGGGFIGYEHEFDNRLVVGIEGSSGLARGGGYGGFNGFNYAGSTVKVGYDMGRVMPYAFAGVDLAKPSYSGRGFAGAGDGLNGLLGSPGKLSSFTTVGAGVDIRVTGQLTVGFAVGHSQSRGAFAPVGAVP